MKKLIFLAMMVTAPFILLACDTQESDNGGPADPVEADSFATPVAPLDGEPGLINEDGYLELTLDELSFYDGKDGRRAYVVVDGLIYDMTDSSRWRNGDHFSGYSAGNDLSIAINRSPHGKGNLQRVPRVGRLVE